MFGSAWRPHGTLDVRIGLAASERPMVSGRPTLNAAQDFGEASTFQDMPAAKHIQLRDEASQAEARPTAQCERQRASTEREAARPNYS